MLGLDTNFYYCDSVSIGIAPLRKSQISLHCPNICPGRILLDCVIYLLLSKELAGSNPVPATTKISPSIDIISSERYGLIEPRENLDI